MTHRGHAHGPLVSDGKLTYAEFSTPAVERFTRVDTDKNGTVTIQELQALAPK